MGALGALGSARLVPFPDERETSRIVLGALSPDWLFGTATQETGAGSVFKGFPRQLEREKGGGVSREPIEIGFPSQLPTS